MNILKQPMGFNNLKTGLFLVLVFSGFALRAQNNLRMLSNNGLFKVYENDKVLNQTAQAEVVLENILKDTLYLKIEFEGQQRTGITLYMLEKGQPTKNKEFCYRVILDGNKVRVDFRGIYEVTALPQPIVPVKPVIDTSMKYRNSRLGHLCELKDGKAFYFKNIPESGRCETPMPDDYLNFIGLLMQKAQVPDEKFTIAENVSRNNCMNTVQLSVLLKYIDYELEKLKLIRIAYSHLTDKNNRKDLEKNFRFESSVLELNKFYKTTDQSPEVISKKCEVASEENKINAFSEKLSPYTNDSQRFEVFKKTYSDYCFTAAQVKTILSKFLHDREKIDAAILMYDRCVEKEKYMDISDVFSYNQSVADLKDFIEKQK